MKMDGILFTNLYHEDRANAGFILTSLRIDELKYHLYNIKQSY